MRPASALSIGLCFGSVSLLACNPTRSHTPTPAALDTAAPLAVELSQVQATPHAKVGSMLEVRWHQDLPATVSLEYQVDPGEWRSTPDQVLPAGEQSRLLVGIPFDHEVGFRLQADPGTGVVSEAQGIGRTDPLPSPLVAPQLETFDAEAVGEDSPWLYFSLNDLAGEQNAWMLIMDRQGRLVWAMENPEFNPYTVWVGTSRAGGTLTWDQSVLFGEETAAVHRMRLDGSITETIELPGQHHSYVELENGWAWGAMEPGTGDETLMVRSPSGTDLELWRCSDFEATTGQSSDRCGSNALFYNAPTDSYFFSFYTSATIVEIDAATGATLRGWGPRGDGKVEPATARFDWQHGVSITDTGTLLTSTHVSFDDNEGVVREYSIDRDTNVLTQVAEFGVGMGIEAEFYGEAHRLPNGNTLQNFGTTPKVREYNAAGEVVWDVHLWPPGSPDGRPTIGRSVLLQDLYEYLP